MTVFPALLVIAAVGDLMTYRIPNWISIALAGLFCGTALVSELSWLQVGVHVGIGILLLMVGMALFQFNFLGGGDAKLLAAAGLWIGWPALPVYLVWVAFAGGMLALCLVLFRRTPLPANLSLSPWVERLHDRNAGIPYGIALAIGAMMALPQTVWFASLV
ncbi:MAG: prepilin peptidase [Parvibaculum sp.]